jgi:hypothetical protein
MLEATLKIVRIKTDISIQFDNELPILTVKAIISIIEGFHYPRTRYTLAAVDTMDGSDPAILLCILVNDSGGAVPRAVIDNHPLRRANCLAKHTINRPFDVFLLIPNGRHDHIFDIGDSRRHGIVVLKS